MTSYETQAIRPCAFCRKPLPKKRKSFCSAKCQAGHMHEHRHGPNHPCYKGGGVTVHGYRRIYVRGKVVREHRYVMEQHLGRKLSRDEHIHHKDKNKLNNDIDNLEIVTKYDHKKKHHCKTFRDETHKQCTICLTTKPRTEFHRARVYGPAQETHQSACVACTIKKKESKNESLSIHRRPKELHQTPRLVTAWGQTKRIAEWAKDKRCKVSYSTMTLRLNAGWSPEDAIATPSPRPTRRA